MANEHSLPEVTFHLALHLDVNQHPRILTRFLPYPHQNIHNPPPALRLPNHLPQFLVEALVDHLSRFSAPGTDGLVFTTPEGTPLRRENFRRRVWYPVMRSVGMDGFRFHDLRHTNATLAASSGAPLRALMARLGHASAAAAIRYQH